MKERKKNPGAVKGVFSSVELDRDFPVSTPSIASRALTEDGLPHLHDSLELGLCDHGCGMFLIGGKILSCRPGDAIIINRHEVHIFKALPGEEIRWRFLNVNIFQLLAQVPETGAWCHRSDFLYGEHFPNRFRPDESPETVYLIRRIFEEMQQQHEGFRLMVRLLVNELLILLGRKYSGKQQPSSAGSVQPEAFIRVAPALKYMALHSAESFPVARLAQLCCISEVHFRRLFHAAVGCSPVDYLLHFRLENAAAMLKGGTLSVDEISRKCGFCTLSYFESKFKLYFSLSPRQYRRSGKTF